MQTQTEDNPHHLNRSKDGKCKPISYKDQPYGIQRRKEKLSAVNNNASKIYSTINNEMANQESRMRKSGIRIKSKKDKKKKVANFF